VAPLTLAIMVDALLSAAAESDDSSFDDMMGSGTNDHFIPTDDPQPPLRFCEFCNSSNTPTWRRGPAGKGSLCNACGIKWRLRKKQKKNEWGGSPSPTPTVPDKKVSPLVVKPPKKRKEVDMYRPPSKAKDKDLAGDYMPPGAINFHKEGPSKRKKYYCKYCDQTFSMSQFRNSQQFGAHCSNCSRRPRDEDGVMVDSGNHYRYSSPYSPSYDRASSPGTPESPDPSLNRDGLLLRLLHVVEHQLVDVHELAEIQGELSSLKTELINREEAMRAELTVIRARVHDDLAEIRSGLRRSVAAHEQLAAHRLMEMEQTIRARTPGALMF